MVIAILLLISSGSGIVAIALWLVRQYHAMPADEFWCGAGIMVFLLFLALAGLVILRQSLWLTNNAVIIHGLRTRTLPLEEVSGYCVSMVRVNFFLICKIGKTRQDDVKRSAHLP